ncbi:Rieske 2Fe-2S domain-containing protein [Nitritalea halalkaliphila]|uniref:Rieske 2Fe-2S domain-containing protein n=1 Tax=Nitritalea halalkaliphila TaxID=590849 RepID=UPI001389E515|nr:Rieske 2Fe-2S domain-containing protein [Nitritalea halalkaliphila]
MKKISVLTGASLLSIPILSSCDSTEEEPLDEEIFDTFSYNLRDPQSPVRFWPNGLILELDRLPELRRTGSWMWIKEANCMVINDRGISYTPLDTRCTHCRNKDRWSYRQEVLTCGHHNSEFDRRGNVRRGPAVAPLLVYSASFSLDNILTVNLTSYSERL